jgi:hypothetical protein
MECFAYRYLNARKECTTVQVHIPVLQSAHRAHFPSTPSTIVQKGLPDTDSRQQTHPKDLRLDCIHTFAIHGCGLDV